MSGNSQSGSHSSSERLPTLRPVRDLTLGQQPQLSAKRLPVATPTSTRKSFVPNVNVKKQRTESADVDKPTKSKVTSIDRKNNKSVDGHKNRESLGRGSRQQYVQSYSMFADGLGSNTRSVGVARLPGGGGGGISGMLSISAMEDSDLPPSQSKQPIILVPEAKEKRHKFISDLKEGHVRPVSVPFETLKMEEEEVVNEESVDILIHPGSAAGLFSKPLNAEGAEIILLQLPDVLPADLLCGKTSSTLFNESSSLNVDPSKDVEARMLNEDSRYDSSSDHMEKRVGSLQIYEDGQVRLQLAGCWFQVDRGADISHLMDIMRFDEVGDKQGDLLTAGHVTRSGVCVPDLDWLLENRFRFNHGEDEPIDNWCSDAEDSN